MYCGHARLCVCLCVCLSASACPHNCRDPDVTWRSGRGCPLVVHYWADLQSVDRLRCYDNITRTRNVSENMLVLALCLVSLCCHKIHWGRKKHNGKRHGSLWRDGCTHLLLLLVPYTASVISPAYTWLMGTDADVQSANIGIHSAWKKTNDRLLWQHIIDTSTLH